MKFFFILLLLTICVACVKYTEINEEQSLKKRSIDETNFVPIMEAYPEKNKEQFITRSGFVLEKCDTTFILDGDILLTQNQVNKLNDPTTRGAVYLGLRSFWSDCRVYYKFDPKFQYQDYVLCTIDSLESRTGLQFIEVENGTNNYIYFYHGNGNNSWIGRVGGKQDISIQDHQPSSYLGV